MTEEIVRADNESLHPAPLIASGNDDLDAIKAVSPGELNVINRHGEAVPYDENRIKVAITKAFLAVEGEPAAESSRVHEKVDQLAHQISHTFMDRLLVNHTLHIEFIQDQVELALMRTGEYQVARKYVIYREERRKARQQEEEAAAQAAIAPTQPTINVKLADGSLAPLNEIRLQTIIREACSDLAATDSDHILNETRQNLFDGMPEADVSRALIMTARTLVEKDPDYSQATARLLLDELRSEALSYLEMTDKATFSEMASLYGDYFKRYLQQGIKLNRLNDKLLAFDLDKIAAALMPERDHLFTYLSLQTLYDRYFLHHDGIRYELPQAFFMRVAMGLALEEKNREARAIEFYHLLSTFDFMSSTPTLFNAGTTRPQLSSCFLTTVGDDLASIYGAIKDNALLSKFAGGLGNDWTPVRAMGAHIHGTNGRSQGVVPFLNVADATAIAVNQGGKRKGAVCGYLEIWHKDIEDFLELRKNTGDDRRRTHDMNTAVWVNDLFMQRVHEKGDWYLFSPDEAPDLHDLYGEAFAKAYQEYETLAQQGKIKNYKKVAALNLWRKVLSMLFETGHPWVTFKDPCNLRSPQQHCGVIHSSNLCTEITLNTSKDEVAVCNLGSVNLPQHLTDNGEINVDKLKKTIHTAIRMLDNVIDINFYTVPQARNSNMKHRPIGLGVMGFQDCLYKQRLPYASEQAIAFADRYQEYISYFAIEASAKLAEERGAYQSFDGSLWSQGILPLDSLQKLVANRPNDYLDLDTHAALDWDSLRQQVKAGMRNSNVMAIAPTATISNICGVSQSIEPTYQNLYVKSNMSGEFTVVNPYLIADLKAHDLWDEVMLNDLKYYDGSIQKIERIPDEIKTLYATAFEIDPHYLVQCAARRQKWIDQAQSLNLYMANPSGKKLDTLYRSCWVSGLKTTYYLRSLGATSTEKSTVTTGALNAVQVNSGAAACAIDDPDCEACQ
ncbi:MAG: ribonucleoside-diphosphate reductase subunit alpha [Gammaproteobacteria bacterium]|nr:ribonucleoside-diphosphate reductase subunit alpha [Gammaproteobacteria bacterium]